MHTIPEQLLSTKEEEIIHNYILCKKGIITKEQLLDKEVQLNPNKLKDLTFYLKNKEELKHQNKLEEEIENFQAMLMFFEEENTTFSNYYFNDHYSN